MLRVGDGSRLGPGAGGRLFPSCPDKQIMVALSKSPALQNGATKPEPTVEDTQKVNPTGLRDEKWERESLGVTSRFGACRIG